jgi:gas vesicle protein
MENRKFNVVGFMKGMLIGGILGVVIALFTAPRSGMETRQLLLEKGEELKDKTVETIDNAREQVETVISDTRQRADEVVQRIGEQISSPSHQE